MRHVDEAENRELLHAQLTIGHWYVDRALDSCGDVGRRYLSFARETCEIIERVSRALNLDGEAREEATRDLILLRAKLQAVGEASGSASG